LGEQRPVRGLSPQMFVPRTCLSGTKASIKTKLPRQSWAVCVCVCVCASMWACPCMWEIGDQRLEYMYNYIEAAGIGRTYNHNNVPVTGQHSGSSISWTCSSGFRILIFDFPSSSWCLGCKYGKKMHIATFACSHIRYIMYLNLQTMTPRGPPTLVMEFHRVLCWDHFYWPYHAS